MIKNWIKMTSVRTVEIKLTTSIKYQNINIEDVVDLQNLIKFTLSKFQNNFPKIKTTNKQILNCIL